MTDQEVLQAIADLLDGVEWSPDTLDEIASLLKRHGFTIREYNPCLKRRPQQ